MYGTEIKEKKSCADTQLLLLGVQQPGSLTNTQFKFKSHVENGLEDTGRRGKLRQSESSTNIYTLPNVR